MDGATLSNAMTRRRHLTEEILRRLAAALGLDGLADMVAGDPARGHRDAAQAGTPGDEVDRSLSAAQAPPIPSAEGFRGIFVELPHPLATWLGRVPFAMAQLPGFVADPRRIAAEMGKNAAPRAIRDTLRTLVQSGALVKGEGGRLLARERYILYLPANESRGESPKPWASN